MSKETKDIYSNERIYVGVPFPYRGQLGLLCKAYYDIQGSHSFKDGQTVVEGVDYKTQYDMTFIGGNPRRIIAIPLPSLSDAGREDAKRFANLSTADKIKCVQGTPELLKAVQLLRAVFDAEDLKSFIRYTYTFQDDKRFEITFMPVLHTETYSNKDIPTTNKSEQ